MQLGQPELPVRQASDLHRETASVAPAAQTAAEPAAEVAGRPSVSRRQLLAGGGLFFGGLLLSGCAGGNRASSARTYPDSETTSFGNAASPTAPAPWTISQQPDWTPVQTWPPAQVPQQPSGRVIVAQPVPQAPQGGIVPRSSWSRSGVARPNEIYAIGGINHITVHHDGMPPAGLRSMGEIASRIEQIRASHVNGRGWADIGYHYVIDPQGRVWEGRNIAYQGAHVKDQNENNMGILVLGNFELQRPTPAALQTLDRFVVAQMQRYRISLSRIKTHRERAQTECPGVNLQSYMLRTRNSGGQLASLAARAGLRA